MDDREPDAPPKMQGPGPARDRRAEPSAGKPGNRRPTDLEATETSNLLDRDKQYGSDDN